MDDTKVLHWLPDEDRWHEVPWNDWAAFRGLMSPSVGLPGISGGIHYFMVCVYDGDLLLNLVPHKYLIEPDGRVGADNFSGLTKKEREDYHRLMIAIENKPENEKRLDEIRNKMSNVFHPRASQ